MMCVTVCDGASDGVFDDVYNIYDGVVSTV